MASSIVDNAQLTFNTVSITEPTESTFTAHVMGVLSDAGPFDGKMLESDVLVYYQPGNGTSRSGIKLAPHDGSSPWKLLGKMRMPEVPVIGGQDSPLNISSMFEVSDKVLFDMMTADLINTEVITWQLSASITLQAQIGVTLTFEEIPFLKEVDLAGAGGFPNVTVLVFDPSNSTPTTVFVELSVLLYNPAIVNIDPLGHLTFEIFYQGSYMGMVICPNASLLVGENRLDMFGELHPENMTAAEELFNLYLTGQDADVVASAADNATTLYLFNEGLKTVSLETVLPGYQSSLVSGLEFLSMSIVPIDNFRVSMSADVLVGIVSPLGPNSPCDIQTVSMAVSLYDGSSNLGLLVTPPVTVTDGANPTILVSLTGELFFYGDGSNFAAFVEKFIQQPSVTLRLTGTADVVTDTALGMLSLKGLPISETATLVAMNNFPDVAILDFDLPSNHPDGGILLQLTTSLTNPSVATMDLGDISLDLYTGSARLGTLFGTAVSMVPGTNILSLSGYVLPDPADLEAVSLFFSSYLAGQDEVVVAYGRDAGSSPIVWLQRVVQSLTLVTVFPGYEDLIVQSLALFSLGIDFPGGAAFPRTSGDVVANFVIPFGFPFQIWQVAVELEAVEQNEPYMQISVPTIPSRSDQQAGKLYFSFLDAPSVITDTPEFTNFVEDIILLPTIDLTLRGSATATVDTAAGNLTLYNLGFFDVLTLNALNSFKTPPMEILALDVVEGQTDRLKLAIDIKITNPSIIYGGLGDLSFDLIANGERVGYAVVKGLDLPLGSLFLENAEGYLLDNGPGSESRQLLTDYIEGTNRLVDLKGIPGSASVPYLDQGVSKLLTSSTLPGLSQQLIMEARINALKTMASILNIFEYPKKAPTRLVIFNPFSVPFIITRTNFIIYRAGEDKIGEFIDNTHMVINPLGQTITEEQDVVLKGISLDLAIAILEALLGGTLLDIKGEMDITIQDFSTTLQYSQYNVPSVAV